MLRITDKNVKVFKSDDEFYRFAVVPQLTVLEYTDKDGNVKYYTDFDFSNEYKRAIEEGKRFVIKDANSQIFKHQAVSYRTVTKKVENLQQYFEPFSQN